MKTIRWILFLPLGIVASVIVGGLTNSLLTFIGGSSWWVWLVSGAVSGGAILLTAFYVAPVLNKFSMWAPILLAGILGTISALGGFLYSTDWTSGLSGAAMIGMAVFVHKDETGKKYTSAHDA